jgi:hypothetical protein
MTVHSVSWIPCSNRLVAAGSNLKNQGTIQVKAGAAGANLKNQGTIQVKAGGCWGQLENPRNHPDYRLLSAAT